MLQDDRTWLFNLAYYFDNLPRIKGSEGQLVVAFNHTKLEKIAEDIRALAAKDEERVMKGANHKGAHEVPNRH